MPRKEGWTVGATAALVISPEGGSDCGRVLTCLGGQEMEHFFKKTMEGDAMSAAQAIMKPEGEVHEAGKGGGVLPEEWSCFQEVAAIGDEIPETGKEAEAAQGRVVQATGLLNLVGRIGAVDHSPLRIVADDGGAAKALEHADLDFLGIQRNKAIKTGGKAREVFAGEADDQIGVDMDAGLLAQESQVGREAVIVLPAVDAGGDIGVEGLDAHLELQGATRESADRLAQGLGQAVGDHLEMDEEARLVAFEEKFEDALADVEIEIECAVDEFELAETAIEQAAHSGEEFAKRDITHGDVEGGEAEFAFEGTAARGLDVDHAMGDVLVVV